MATSSIFSNIQIRDEESCRSLADAIESSMRAKTKESSIPKGIKVVESVEEAKRIFAKRG
jgi:hypothetical protein